MVPAEGELGRTAEEWLDEGRRFIAWSKLARAEACFQKAVAISPIPAALNNLALVQLEHHGDPARALAILAPTLALTPAHPYAHALAARCYVRLRDVAASEGHLRTAIDAFQSAIADPASPWNIGRRALCEYTAAILQAAGDLGDDRRTWDLYQRWRALHVLPVCDFFGGVAAFNCGRFTQARRTWRQVLDPDWEFLESFTALAEMFDAGTLPPLRLCYTAPRVDDLKAAIGDDARTSLEEIVARVAANSINLMMLLHVAFGRDREDQPGSEKNRSLAISALVAGTGEWGQRLAVSLFASARAPMHWKMAALTGLHRAGKVALNEPVSMLVDGKPQDVALKQMRAILGVGAKMEQQHRTAIALRDSGKLEGARHLLEEFTRGDELYVPGVLTYASVLRAQGQLAEARRWLGLLHDICPDHPIVLLNLAGVCAQEGDLEAARRYLDAAGIDDLPPEVAEKAAQFAVAIDS